jgi:hypothetical protein
VAETDEILHVLLWLLESTRGIQLQWLEFDESDPRGRDMSPGYWPEPPLIAA